MMTPSFNYQAIECSNELWGKMESYWNKLGEDQELNFSKNISVIDYINYLKFENVWCQK
jgi:hypothetical protein